MNNLLNEIEIALKKNNLDSFLDVIDNREKSAKYIKTLLKEEMDLPDKVISIENLKTKFGDRANHILYTFALGILLSDFDGLKYKIEQSYAKYFVDKNNVFFKTWLITSLYHDYGYFLFNIYNSIASLEDFKVRNVIFDYKEEEKDAMKLFGLISDLQEKSRYSKQIYEYYFEGIVLKRDTDEPFEHGIAGGYVLFDDLISYSTKKDVKSRKEIKKAMGVRCNDVNNDSFYQNVCYRIMEHNIWKIKYKDSFFDSFNKTMLKDIVNNNFIKISNNEPLLFLLSLVDTIEFVKRMSTTSLDNLTSQSRPTTLSKKILIDVGQNEIILDINAVKNIVGFDKWKNGIVGIDDWVKVNVNYNEGIITIKTL